MSNMSGGFFANLRDTLLHSLGVIGNPLVVSQSGTIDTELVDGSNNPLGVSGNPLFVTDKGMGTIVAFGQTAVLATASALGSNVCTSVTLKALIGNTIFVYVGGAGVTTGTGFELTMGQAITLSVSNTNQIYLIASTTGASVCWIATN
jgi:hypothetical protein